MDAMILPQVGETIYLEEIEKICLYFGLTDLWEKIKKGPPPKVFSSDGCTMWFDEWRGVSLYNACFLHDLKFWAGYPGEDVERLVADAELMIDVAKALDGVDMAQVMFAGVRAGGCEGLRQGFSWGFGIRISKFHLNYGRASYHLAGASNHFSITTDLSSFSRN